MTVKVIYTTDYKASRNLSYIIHCMFNDLTGRIDTLLAQKPHIIVGVSGFAGSGKTYLADKLTQHYQITDSQVIHLDNLYAPMPRGTGLFDDYDWDLLIQILENSLEQKDLNYQGTGFDGNSYKWQFRQKLPRVLIVEGIRLFRPEYMHYFDLSVWVDCPPELALKRAKARDLSQGHDAQYMQRWDAEWMPLNMKYFTTYRPTELANFLYKDFGS